MRRTFSNGVRGLLRLGQTARVCAGVGLEWVLGERPPTPQLLRRTFERLGATYIKLGQFIASSPSLFPGGYVREFQCCLDRTEVLPFAVMQSVLASDLNFLYVTAKVLELLAPRLAHASLSAIVEEIQTGIMAECDFLREAGNIRQFDRFLRDTGNDRVIVPRVYEHATTLGVLTMERLYGVALSDADSIQCYVDNPEDTLIDAMNTWFTSVLMCDFFHADLHAGNLMVLDDGRIGFIDFGIVGRIEQAV